MNINSKYKIIFIAAAAIVSSVFASGKYFNRNSHTHCVNSFSEQKYNNAVQTCTPLSEQGNKAASLILGKIYFEGWNGKKDYSKALSELVKAEKSNDLNVSNEAKAGLGDLYKERDFTKYNLETSYKWFELAAIKNHPRSQMVAGAMLYLGQGVPKNITLAKEYLLKAADNGENEALNLLAGINEEI